LLAVVLCTICPSPAAASQATARMVGGTAVTGPNWNAWYSSVAAIAGRDQDGYGWRCTGAVIAPRLVLTAGHCLEGATRVQVAVGVRDLALESPTVLNGTGVSFHPDWRGGAGLDAALVHLDGDAPVPPVAIAGADEDGLWGAGLGRIATAETGIRSAGWGWTVGDVLSPSDALVEATFDALAHTSCGYYRGYDPSWMFCLGSRTASSCNGDSGAPLLAANAGSVRLVGIVNGGEDGCPTGPWVGVHARALRGWLGAHGASIAATTWQGPTATASGGGALPSFRVRSVTGTILFRRGSSTARLKLSGRYRTSARKVRVQVVATRRGKRLVRRWVVGTKRSFTFNRTFGGFRRGVPVKVRISFYADGFPTVYLGTFRTR
jgi:hypothetical protein